MRVAMKALLSALIVLLLAPASAGSAGLSPGPASPGDAMIAAQWDAAANASGQGDNATALIALEPAMQDAVLAQLSPAKKHDVLQLYAFAAEQTAQWEKAHAALVRLTADPSVDDNDWGERWHAAMQLGDAADALECFHHLAGRHAFVLTLMGWHGIMELQELENQAPDPIGAHLEIGRQLEREDWRPEAGHDDLGFIWLPYVQALVERGDETKAAAIAQRITNPASLIAMQSDRRFDKLVASDPARYDPEASAQRLLQRARSLADSHPQYMAPKIAVMNALGYLDHPADSLAISDDVLRTVGRDRGAYVDADLIPQIIGEHDDALMRVGREQEAIDAALADAQAVNTPFEYQSLGRTLVRVGRGADALYWLRRGHCDCLGVHLRVESMRATACADVQVGNQEDLAKQLEWLRTHEAWNPPGAVDGLICADRMDEAAEAYKRLLADPRTRLEMLVELQTYAAAPSTPKFNVLFYQRMAQLAARPDIREAVAKVGRIKSYALTDMSPQF
jgi:hypothetical protein